ncbi:MAG: zinc ribbon domain-containing protein [Chloroflexi bacterium]|nr:zinc ribbon domain-containing protein [Chloroflexota bacterium]
MIYCQNCGVANREGSRFCNECGQRLGLYVPCPSCGLANLSTARFCNFCGASLSLAQQAPAQAPVHEENEPLESDVPPPFGGSVLPLVAPDEKLGAQSPAVAADPSFLLAEAVPLPPIEAADTQATPGADFPIEDEIVAIEEIDEAAIEEIEEVDEAALVEEIILDEKWTRPYPDVHLAASVDTTPLVPAESSTELVVPSTSTIQLEEPLLIERESSVAAVNLQQDVETPLVFLPPEEPATTEWGLASEDVVDETQAGAGSPAEPISLPAWLVEASSADSPERVAAAIGSMWRREPVVADVASAPAEFGATLQARIGREEGIALARSFARGRRTTSSRPLSPQQAFESAGAVFAGVTASSWDSFAVERTKPVPNRVPQAKPSSGTRRLIMDLILLLLVVLLLFLTFSGTMDDSDGSSLRAQLESAVQAIGRLAGSWLPR